MKMKNIFTIILTIFILSSIGFAQTFPKKTDSLVNDYTKTLSPQEKYSLENKLVAFDDSTTTQICIVIMRSVSGYDISDYAVKLYNSWGIGSKKNNNGALIFIALDDHKAWITTGYGLEGALPDITARHIIADDMTPFFKQGKYFEGLDKATGTIISLVKGEYKASDYEKRRGHISSREQKPMGFIFIAIFVIIAIVLFYRVNAVRNYAKNNGLTFLAAWVLFNAVSNTGRGGWNNFTSGGGGFGGWGGGGSSSGGGFGGFGGGSSGGGGAGGSW